MAEERDYVEEVVKGAEHFVDVMQLAFKGRSPRVIGVEVVARWVVRGAEHFLLGRAYMVMYPYLVSYVHVYSIIRYGLHSEMGRQGSTAPRRHAAARLQRVRPYRYSGMVTCGLGIAGEGCG